MGKKADLLLLGPGVRATLVSKIDGFGKAEGLFTRKFDASLSLLLVN